jgi:endonuclease/exonuclease/phosphatase family metal-dependent hydrolase
MPRLATFNVHSFYTRKGEYSFDDCIKAVSSLDLDVLAVQENYGMQFGNPIIQLFGSLINLPHIYHHPQSPLLLYSKSPHLESFKVNLGYDGETRMAIFVTMELTTSSPNSTKIFDVCCTHLSHTLESLRQQQVDVLLKTCQDLDARHSTDFGDKYGGIICMGDFNSLRIADYFDMDVTEITTERRNNMWELPMNNVVSTMDNAGFVDLYRWHLLLQWQQQGSIRVPFNVDDEDLKSRACSGTFDRESYAASLTSNDLKTSRWCCHTCWAKTRIDFIWVSERVASRLTGVKEYWHIRSYASDHYPVYCDVTFT